MINTFLIHYQQYTDIQRRWLCVVFSLLFVSATETKMIIQHIEVLRSAEHQYHLADQVLKNQTRVLQQAQTFTAAIQKSQSLLQTEDLENSFTRTAQQTQIFNLTLHADGTHQYTLNATAPWQTSLNWLARIKSTSKPTALTLTHNPEENTWAIALQIETLNTPITQPKHNPSSLIPTEIEWLGLLHKGAQSWVFLKQADQTILGLSCNEYIPATHWQVRTLTAKKMVLENSDSHEYFTRDFV